MVEWLRGGVPVLLVARPERPHLPRPTPTQARQFRQHLQELLAIKAVSPTRHPRLLSPIFTVPKGDSGQTRLIHDLQCLNAASAEVRTFRLYGVRRAVTLLAPGDAMIRLDLVKGYYEVGVRLEDRSLLSFMVDGRPYHFNVLPFGWSAAPFHFQAIMLEAASIVGTRYGVKIVVYLDDWLVMAAPEHLGSVREALLKDLGLMGLIINLSKSELTPCFVTTFLGFQLNAQTRELSLAPEKVARYRSRVQEARRGPLSGWEWDRLLGNLSFASAAWQDGRAWLRALQRAGARQWPLPSLASESLAHWAKMLLPDAPQRPRSFADMIAVWGTKPSLDITIVSDAASSSIGATITGPGMAPTSFARSVPQWEDKHITEVEFMAAAAAVEHLLSDPEVHQREISLFSDNTATVSWINRQGSTRAPESVIRTIQDLWLRLAARGVSIRAHHIQGHLNVTADSLSRFEKLDWSTPRGVLHRIMTEWGPVQRDVSGHPTKELLLPSFAAERVTRSQRGLESRWIGQRIFVAPPWAMIPLVLAKLVAIGVPLGDRQPRSVRSAAIVVVPNIRSTPVRALKRLTPLRMYFRVPEQQLESSELSGLSSGASIRLVALFVATSGSPPRAAIHC